jgi:hypothetical protein
VTTPVISFKESPSLVSLGLLVPSRGSPMRIASGLESSHQLINVHVIDLNDNHTSIC